MSKPRIADIISKKRDGHELDENEIQTFVQAVVNEVAQPAQIGAWLMAAYIQSLSEQETIYLTRHMMESGEILTWPPAWKGRVVDKHSTGGVGDKVSLILAPALAACGMKVPMISGRGLGHTGGTLDKLEAIPDFTVSLSSEHMLKVLTSVGCCIVGQTKKLVPADATLYAIRDVTSTVSNIGLITASIISKKAAEGLDCLVLDVKTGNGAFMVDPSDAERLAKMMVSAGCGLGIRTTAIISTMNAPLGRAVGHSLEVAESVRCLQERGPEDLMDLVIQTGALVLHSAGQATSLQEGQDKIRKVIHDGTALAKFRDMVVAQGVSRENADRLCNVTSDPMDVLPRAKYTTHLTCRAAGYVQSINAMSCAQALLKLGAGRNRAGDSLDLSVGLQLAVTVGDRTPSDLIWATLHHSSPEVPDDIMTELRNAIVITNSEVPLQSRIVKVIELENIS